MRRISQRPRPVRGAVGVFLFVSIFAFVAGPLAAQEALSGDRPGTARKLVVHVPSSPVESTAAQAAALETLASSVTAGVDGLRLEPQLFRRLADASAFVDASPEEAVLVLSDAAWVPELAERGWQPAFRLERGGSGTYRRVLVVPASAGATSLADLAGSSLTVVESAKDTESFLRDVIFGGELEPSEHFSAVAAEADDVGAVNAVLFGRSDAALVAEHNPLLQRSLGGDGEAELRVIYRSPELSLPVLSVRAASFDAAARDALAATFAGLAPDALSSWGFDRLVGLDAGARSALLRRPEEVDVEYEITAPDSGALRLEPPAAPPSQALPYRLTIELPRVDVEESGGESP